MKCFYHRDKDAIGICKSCSRALCQECAAEFPKGIACKGRCEEDVRAVIELIERNVRLTKSVSAGGGRFGR